MYTRYKNSMGYGVCTYVCDTKADLDLCPTSTAAPGSVALVIETSAMYRLNHQKKWVKQTTSESGGGGGGGDDLDPTKRYIWDGGVVK